MSSKRSKILFLSCSIYSMVWFRLKSYFRSSRRGEISREGRPCWILAIARSHYWYSTLESGSCRIPTLSPSAPNRPLTPLRVLTSHQPFGINNYKVINKRYPTSSFYNNQEFRREFGINASISSKGWFVRIHVGNI